MVIFDHCLEIVKLNFIKVRPKGNFLLHFWAISPKNPHALSQKFLVVPQPAQLQTPGLPKLKGAWIAGSGNFPGVGRVGLLPMGVGWRNFIPQKDSQPLSVFAA